jgi:hypothetical protein
MMMTLIMILEMRRTLRFNLEDGLLTIFRIHYNCQSKLISDTATPVSDCLMAKTICASVKFDFSMSENSTF